MHRQIKIFYDWVNIHTEFIRYFSFRKHYKVKFFKKIISQIAVIYFISLHYIINNNGKARELNNKTFISLPPLRKRKSLSSDALQDLPPTAHPVTRSRV